mmetsp:Transcript_21598/g.34418  ORF Transcript_21598/g.34418 Transcript_21598/m.34418 type:complete len:292 (+) Transcript_21598:77-952(+)
MTVAVQERNRFEYSKDVGYDENNEDQTTTDTEECDCSHDDEPTSGLVPVMPSKLSKMPSTDICESTNVEITTSDDEEDDAQELRPFAAEETVLIFDWDDTILPSAWVQSQGLRLDEESKVSESQRAELSKAASAASETLRAAKQHGTVVFVTNAERGWIELSCQKFLPTLYPVLENVKLLSARTTYETPTLSNPQEWKLRAFDSEIKRIYGEEKMLEPERRKNVLSLGDSMHEREALHRATRNIPNCRSKSLKFCERPDISQICKQHNLVLGQFERIVHHDENLDLCIRCS